VKPLVLLDVDGPLNPFAAETPPPGYAEWQWRLSRWRRKAARRAWLNPGHGVALRELVERTGAELAWATSWEELANTTVGPALGLPALPVVGVRAYDQHPDWKYGAVGRFAAGRALAWLDDDFSLFPAARERFLARRGELVTALIEVDPTAGLDAGHLAAVETALRAGR